MLVVIGIENRTECQILFVPSTKYFPYELSHILLKPLNSGLSERQLMMRPIELSIFYGISLNIRIIKIKYVVSLYHIFHQKALFEYFIKIPTKTMKDLGFVCEYVHRIKSLFDSYNNK